MSQNLQIRTVSPTLIPCVQWGFVLRRVSETDDRAVVSLIDDVMSEFGCSGGRGPSDPDRKLAAQFQRRRHFFYVLEDRVGKIVGCAGVAPLKGLSRSAFTCELSKMYFRTTARGQGLGKWLLEACLAEARRTGFRRIYLETSSRMTRAQGLYEKMGFRRLEAPLGKTGESQGCDLYYLLEL